MKYLIVLAAFIVLFSAVIVFAIPNPAPIYCEEMGYTDNSTHCIFDDNTSCEMWDFYKGDCGSDYVKELYCTKIGAEKLPGHECCEGLVAISPLSLALKDDDDICMFGTGSFGICSPCGNGVCDAEYENECNCKEDCVIKEPKCSDCPFPCGKYSCEVLKENNFPCVFIETYESQYCTAKYLCWVKSNAQCIEKTDAATCLGECVDNKFETCFGKNVFNIKSECLSVVEKEKQEEKDNEEEKEQKIAPDCWTCAPEKYKTWNSLADTYCDNYGVYSCGETSSKNSYCYQASCEKTPPSCWKGTIGQYDASYADGVCETQWGATNNRDSACYDIDCDIRSCDGFRGDDICDDTKEKCGSFFKNWTSMQLCGECSNGGFNCTQPTLANPAAVYCEEQGGTHKLEDTNLGQLGVCVFSDTIEIEAWRYYNLEHGIINCTQINGTEILSTQECDSGYLAAKTTDVCKSCVCCVDSS